MRYNLSSIQDSSRNLQNQNVQNTFHHVQDHLQQPVPQADELSEFDILGTENISESDEESDCWVPASQKTLKPRAELAGNAVGQRAQEPCEQYMAAVAGQSPNHFMQQESKQRKRQQSTS